MTRIKLVLLGFLIFAMGPAASADPGIVTEEGPMRRVIASATIDAPLKEAWADWATQEGVESFFAPAARIDLRPGGPYEVYFLPNAEPGQRGSEGTSVLGYQTERMLSVTWALPPYMPEVRPHLTPLTIHFEAQGPEQTTVTVVHGGWGTGKAWDEAYDYFASTWPQVLAAQSQKYHRTE